MNAPELPTFASVLRRHRLAAGLSQEELAERAGLSTRGVSDIERGLRLTPRPETVRMLADGLGLDDAERTSLIAASHPELTAPDAVPPPSPEAAQKPVAPLALAPLPIPPTRLVGRTSERARLRELLTDTGGRLVTLTGPGGVGKTRLALEVAAELGRTGPFAGAVALIELAALRDAAQVPPAIGRALGLRESAGIPIERQVIEALGGRRLLLILDNCEHLLAATPFVADLLASCAGLVVLATSRERLRLRGERVVAVPPLSLSASSDAVQLFVERVIDVRPDFALTEANAAAVLSICERLDGLPLALELAAAWASAFPPAALLAHLDRRLPLLVGGAADLPERQQALRDTIAWSYDLLTPDEQTLFRRLAVFAGGFTIEGASVIAGGTAAVPGVMALHEKSLLRTSDGPDQQPRFTMLETIREFALEMLATAGEAAATREAHARHVLSIAVEADGLLSGPAQIATLRRLDAEDANLDAALGWLIEHDPAAALEMASSLWLYWSESGRQRIGRVWLERALAAGAGEGTFQRARALLKLGNLAIDLDEFSEARTLYGASLEIWRALGEPRGVASCLTGLGLVAAQQGDPEAALAMHEESLRIWQAAGDRSSAALCLLNLGHVYLALGNPDRAAELFTTCLELRQDFSDEIGTAYVYAGLAQATAARHEPTDARRLLSLSQDLFERVGDPIGRAYLLTLFARLASDDQAGEETVRLYRDALRLRRQAGFRLGMVECLEGIAMVWVGMGAVEDGVMLFGAAARWRERMGSSAAGEERTQLERGIETTRGLLPGATWEDRWAAGTELSLDQAAKLALGEADSDPARHVQAARATPGPLTCVR